MPAIVQISNEKLSDMLAVDYVISKKYLNTFFLFSTNNLCLLSGNDSCTILIQTTCFYSPLFYWKKPTHIRPNAYLSCSSVRIMVSLKLFSFTMVKCYIWLPKEYRIFFRMACQGPQSPKIVMPWQNLQLI